MQLQGKRALVCGSTQGIGLASAIALAEIGASVTLAGRNADRLSETIGTLPVVDQDQKHHFMVIDSTDPEAASEAVANEVWMHGPIAILVNNTAGPPGGQITEATSDQFLAAFTSHLLTNHRLSQAVLPGMRQLGYGRIVNIVSTSVRQPIPGLGVSNTTRGAVASWAKTLSMEVAKDGITVNNILPGSTMTGRLESLIASRAQASGRSERQIQEEMQAEIPMGRFAAPAEIAAAVVFLASPAASYITGVSLAVDGGRVSSL